VDDISQVREDYRAVAADSEARTLFMERQEAYAKSRREQAESLESWLARNQEEKHSRDIDAKAARLER
jgi:hypothetical protein